MKSGLKFQVRRIRPIVLGPFVTSQVSETTGRTALVSCSSVIPRSSQFSVEIVRKQARHRAIGNNLSEKSFTYHAGKRLLPSRQLPQRLFRAVFSGNVKCRCLCVIGVPLRNVAIFRSPRNCNPISACGATRLSHPEARSRSEINSIGSPEALSLPVVRRANAKKADHVNAKKREQNTGRYV